MMCSESTLFTHNEAVATISLISQQLEKRGGELDRIQLSAMGKILSLVHLVLTDQNTKEKK